MIILLVWDWPFIFTEHKYKPSLRFKFSMFTWFAERSDTNLTNCPVAEYILTSVIMPLSDWIVKFWFAGLGNRLIPDSVLIKSFKPGAAQSGESQIASQSPAPAQIASQSQSQSQISQSSQALTPERTGPTVIVSQNPSSPARQMMYSGGGGSSGGGSSPISDFALLNNFIKNKLLLDLAYL